MTLIDWLRRRRRDEDLEDEIRTHLSMAAQDRMDAGGDPRSARLAAIGCAHALPGKRAAAWGVGYGGRRDRLARADEAAGQPPLRGQSHRRRLVGTAAATVLVIVLGASFFPAWRASRTDPSAALRHR